MSKQTAPRVTLIVPTLGRSSHLEACLEALQIEVTSDDEIIVAVPEGEASRVRDRVSGCEVLEVPDGSGFAGGCNAAIASSRAKFVGLINDDAIVERGWLQRLVAALEDDPRCAAVQGVNLQLGRPDSVDGGGIAWNSWWQAVQIGRGLPASLCREKCEIFGVSGTAALLCRAALQQVVLDGDRVFDSRLGSYYEDVDLACRLRAAGLGAVAVAIARASHAGAASSAEAESWRYRQVYSNRILVLARLFGWAFWPRLPQILMRDLVDVAKSALSGRGSRVAGIARGWLRAARLLPGFAHRGRSLLAIPELRRFQIDGATGRGRPDSAHPAN